MPIICRLLSVPSDLTSLDKILSESKNYSDIYRYWDGIHFLLKKSGVQFLELGSEISSSETRKPRLLSKDEVQSFSNAISNIEPDSLAQYYDSKEFDENGVYPELWVSWEEDFDPLGQTLEHYSFLRDFANNCAKRGEGMLLYFTFLDEGSV